VSKGSYFLLTQYDKNYGLIHMNMLRREIADIDVLKYDAAQSYNTIYSIRI